VSLLSRFLSTLGLAGLAVLVTFLFFPATVAQVGVVAAGREGGDRTLGLPGVIKWLEALELLGTVGWVRLPGTVGLSANLKSLRLKTTVLLVFFLAVASSILGGA